MAYDRTKLNDGEVQTFLNAHPNWKREGDALVREFRFEGFLKAIAFVNEVAKLAEADNHHPDIDIRYTKVRLLWTTHDAGGLTFRDTKLASACDELFSR